MGREWYWVGGKSSKRGGADTTTGCMCSVFQLFDFHHQHQQQHPPLNLDSLLPDEKHPSISKGSEAPRNSLELDHEPAAYSSSLNIPMGIQIKTPNDSSSSEISCSPSTKTPTLVARLMGLDLLPDQSSSCSPIETPKSYSRRRQSKHGVSGTRSLPETPRISSARKSDVEHRLSLQINKENMSPSEEENSRSPGQYARQIVKQVKESISRKVGLDITNTDHELVNQLRTKKIMSKKILTKANGNVDDSSNSTASCSPRLKLLEPPKNNNKVSIKDHSVKSQKPSISATNSSLQVNIMAQKTAKVPQEQQQRPIKKLVAEERFGPVKKKKPPQTWDVIRNKQEEPFVKANNILPDRKCKKTPLSNELLNITVPALVPVKKDPTTKIPHHQQAQNDSAQESKHSSQLPSRSSHSYKVMQLHTTTTTLNARGSSSNNEDRRYNGAASTTATATATTGDGSAEEYEYISKILKRIGIDNDTLVSFTRWFSPSHPLDPSIFYYLEYFTTISPSTSSFSSKSNGQLGHRCNRKLLFHLVDEILVDILKPYLNMKPWVDKFGYSGTINHKGSDLVDMLCSKIRSFPCADCRVLEDIDALVGKDMTHLNDQNHVAFGEEGEGIVSELEKDLLDTLIHETAVTFYGLI